ncbi:MAG: transposase, partial [Bacteroidota bacterium]
MDELPIFTAALGIEAPWYIKRVYFETVDAQSQLFIEVAHRRRTRFECQGEKYPVYDHQKRRWRHLNFFQHECYLYGDIPRVKTREGNVLLVDVPWAKPGSSFTLLFEQLVLAQIKGGMSARSAGSLMGISGKRVFGIVNRYVSTALSHQELDPVKHLSVDETSSRKGHRYLTIMTDRTARKVVGVAVGKDKEAFSNALIDMEIRGADRTEVRTVTMDMSRSYIAGVSETMPQAEITFDRFHIASKMNEAVDKIRRNDDAIKSSRITPLNNWIKEARASKLEPVRDFVRMLYQHWYGIKAYFQKVASNAFAERVNLKIQEIKRTAKGYRNIQNFITMIYFHLG